MLKQVVKCFWVVVLSGILLLSTGCASGNSEKDSTNWAFYNYGQTINGVSGKKGIDINMPDADESTSTISNALIAIVDTGCYINVNHEDFYWHNAQESADNQDNDNNELVDDILGWDFFNDDNSIYDNFSDDYHGTYISEIIYSMAPNCKVLPLKFMCGSRGTEEDCLKAIQYAIDKGARVINCSWFFSTFNKDFDALIRDNPEVIFVCAAGNEYLDLDENPIYPACYDYDNIITVMAIDSQGKAYQYSGYGGSIDLAAPGVNVLVTLPESTTDYLDGTSVAVPFVTGAVGLILSVNPRLSAAEVKQLLISTSTPLNSLTGCCSGGLLNVSKALKSEER